MNKQIASLRSRSRSAGPTGASNRRRRKDRRKDAAGDTKSSKRSPSIEGNQLAEGRGTARRVGSRFGKG
jgi:hypothetical protein